MLKISCRSAAYVAVAATCLTTSSVSAQLPGGGIIGGAAGQAQSQAQAQVQQRTQAQVQQRVQAQIQQKTQVQAQQRAQGQVAAGIQARVQGRVEADAARAVGIAQRAAQRIDAGVSTTRSHVPNGANANASANASAQGRFSGRNHSTEAAAQSSLNAQASTSLPPGISEADVSLYDNIFGRFNPLRGQAAAAAESTTDAGMAKRPPRGENRVARSESRGAETTEQESSSPQSILGTDLGVTAAARGGFASRVVFAAQQRRAEISQIRDQAVASGDTSLLVRADEMEQRINAFAEASSRARFAEMSDTPQAIETPQPGGETPEARVARRPQSRANGSANGSAAGQGNTQLR